MTRAVLQLGGAAPIRRFTVEEYHRVIGAGILTEDDRVELLEGLIVRKMTRNPPHDATLMRLDDMLRRRLPAEWRVRIQSAIVTADSEPEPDLAVVAGPIERYQKAHPRPKDVALVVEIADATLRRDRGPKRRLYARASVQVYWIVNLVSRQVEVYTEPSGNRRPARYGRMQTYAEGDEVPLVLGGQTLKPINVRQLLGIRRENGAAN